MEICWAAQRAGLYYTAISRYLTEKEIAYIVRDCGAKIFITTPKCAEKVQGLIKGEKGEPLYFMVDEPEEGFRSWDKEAIPQPTTPIADQVAGYDMLYSSGTTGRPKGIKRESENNPIELPNALLKILCADMCGMSSDSIYLSPAPLYHAAPLRFNMMAIILGGTSIIMESFDAEEFLKLIEKHKVTQSQLVPTMFVRMLKLPEGVRTLGDVGYLDAEGFLYLTDRKSYMIISGGVNIYPQETEDVLITHPDVADVAVFGVPNEEMGEEVKAVVQPHDMARAGKEFEAQLIVFCRKHLSPIKCPRSIDFEAELPRTPTGKLVKRHLRDRYWPKAAAKG
jgi:acyl-CoA synthetase (AMP-forming)/AMP-acid ligase II